jgi:hypothetical protein
MLRLRAKRERERKKKTKILNPFFSRLHFLATFSVSATELLEIRNKRETQGTTNTVICLVVIKIERDFSLTFSPSHACMCVSKPLFSRS